MSQRNPSLPVPSPVPFEDAPLESSRSPPHRLDSTENSTRPPLGATEADAKPPRPTVPSGTATAHPSAATSSRKVCAYVTRNDEELLVFEGPGHDGAQIPKGTVEGDEPLERALRREVREESGLRPRGPLTPLASDVWMRRHHPPRYYVRHFYHVAVDEPRDGWTHTVTGSGEEAGAEFTYSWVPIDVATDFALDLDDYVPLLRERL